jgi:hypothetical protein
MPYRCNRMQAGRYARQRVASTIRCKAGLWPARNIQKDKMYISFRREFPLLVNDLAGSCCLVCFVLYNVSLTRIDAWHQAS